MFLRAPAIILTLALTCLAVPVKDAPAGNVQEPETHLAIPSRKGLSPETIPGIEYPEHWDETMQHGIMCGQFSSGNAATFYTSSFWALGDRVSVTSPGHYKIATNGASGEGTLVSIVVLF